jgi:lysophospholipase L1-like esterase
MTENILLAICVTLPVVLGVLLAVCIRKIRRGQATGRWFLVAVNAAVLLQMVSVAFLAGEVYFRFVHDTTDSFLYTKVSRRWLEQHYLTNNIGVRDNIHYPFQITPGKRRLTFHGDSFTVGHGLNDVNDRFVNLIRQANRQAEVHMLAGDGLDTGAQFEVLQRSFTERYEFDVVVLVYCLNDISDIMPDWTGLLSRIHGLAVREHWLIRESYFANTLYYRYTVGRDPDVANYFQFVKSAYRGPLWEHQKIRLKAMRDQVQVAGGKLLVVTFPFLHALGTNYEYKFAHEQLADFWRELGVPHADLLPTFQGIPPVELVVNRYDAHPNEYAHALAAEAIAKFLKEQVADKPAVP